MPEKSTTKQVFSEKVQGKGSWVQFRKITYGESKALTAENKEHEGDAEWQAQRTEQLLRDHILKWNWVDEDGQALPLPSEDPAVLDSLTGDEISFLAGLFQSEDPKK